MLRKLALLVVVSIVGVAWSATANAAVTCAYTAGNARVTVTLGASQDYADITRSGDKIFVSGTALAVQQCGTATVKNTNAIYVIGGAGQQSLELDLRHGALVPGKTKESRGVSEIEIVADLGAGTDLLTVMGTSKGDLYTLGSGGLNLTADMDKDVTPTGVDAWTFSAQGGNDVITLAGGRGTGGKYAAPNVILGGGDGNDTITGGPAVDFITGNAGNDVLNGGDGADTVYGDAGHDILNGGNEVDYLVPGLGNDKVNAGAGSDTMGTEIGRDGSDDFVGGPGRDALYATSRTGNMKISLNNKRDDGLSNEKDNVHSDIETVYTGTGNDTLVGGAGVDNFDGGGGNDTLFGGANDDFLSGGDGNDKVNGGLGDDTLNGGLDLDTLNGDGGDDFLYPGMGNDTANGGAGNDWLYAESTVDGADVYFGSVGVDVIYFFSRTIGVGISLNNLADDGQTLEGDNVKADFEMIYGGSGPDFLSGNAADNRIFGGGGGDSIQGGDGQDYLFGGVGADVLTGGDGTDIIRGEDDGDVLNANDGAYDQVIGGNGTDTCNADAGIDYLETCP